MDSNDWVELYRAGLYGVLAIIGGAVSYICNAEEFSIRMFIVKSISSGFAGFLIGLLCIYMALPTSLSFCISGTFGYLGAEVTIAMLKRYLMKKIK